ncbi:MAG: shikimate dehydrogenase [Gammaproteobacteria bacterium]|nr:shikimate dehydrogenase [Gammaproteobacteria bacterium]NNF60367.1 shikimate dehydrogenase [Gammaproteobacteria bacterium]
MTDRYAVIGHPVAHSRSPEIHEHFAKQTGQQLSYELIDCAPAELNATVGRFFSAGGKGLNITAPHKQSAFLLADLIAMRARVAGAANTLKLEADGQISGDNTDGTGLIRDLAQNLGLALSGRRILLLGAGGAARGILAQLLGQRPAALVIANRTHEKALKLAETFSGMGNVSAGRLERLTEGFDLILNAIASGPDDAGPAIDPVAATSAHCYDLTYTSEDTPFMAWARNSNAASVHDGWGMLVEQAAESFYIWRRVWPDTTDLLNRKRM